MIRPYIDSYFSSARVTSTAATEIARIPIGLGEEMALGKAEFMIGALGGGGRALLDEPRIRFFKSGATLLLSTPTRPEPPDRRGPLATATMEIVAVGTDIVVRVTLPSVNPVDIFVSCEIRGFAGAP